MGYADQRWFLNMVVEAETALFPVQLPGPAFPGSSAIWDECAPIPNGPRTIDVDILVHGQTVMRSPRLGTPPPAHAPGAAS